METQKSSNFTESIFDSEKTGDSKLWVSVEQNSSLYNTLMTFQDVKSGYVGKKSLTQSGNECIIPQYFVLNQKYLYFKKTSESQKIAGVMELKWARIEVHQEKF